MQYIVNLGKHRRWHYINSGDTDGLILSRRLLPDGTVVTIKRKLVGYNWVVLDDDRYYPIDLLTPINKTISILRKLL